MRIWFVVYHVIEFVCGHWLVDQWSDQEPLSPWLATGKSPANHWSITTPYHFFLLFSCLVVFVSVIFLYCTFTGVYNNNNNNNNNNNIRVLKSLDNSLTTVATMDHQSTLRRRRERERERRAHETPEQREARLSQRRLRDRERARERLTPSETPERLGFLNAVCMIYRERARERLTPQ